MTSLFEVLNNINVNGHTEQKSGLTYLSWAWAWAEVKKVRPDAQYKIYERDTEFGPVNYFTDGRTCWVKTGVILDEIEHIEELPVMDFKNRSIPYEAVTSMDVNKAIQRSLTKACARHGLGLYIYAGEDLPEGEADPKLEIKPSKEPTATDSLRERPASQEAIQKILAAASESQKGAMFAKYGDKLEKLSEYGALQVMHKLGVA